MKSLLLLLIAVVTVFSLVPNRSFVERTSRSTIPPGWTQAGVPSPHTLVPFTFVLRLRKARELEEKFWAVSDPDSSEYTNYLSLEQIAKEFGPSNEEIATLERFLASYGLHDFKLTLSRGFLEVSMPIQTAEKMFQVKFYNFVHDTLPTTIRTLDAYSLPSDVARVVHFVTGMHRFPRKNGLSVVRRFRGTGPEFGEITPQDIWKAFNTNGEKGSAKNNIQGVAQFLDQFFNPADLSLFQQTYSLPNQPAANIVGPNNPSDPGTEATLDIEYISGTAPLIPTWFWSTGPPLHGGQEDFVRWAQDMNNATTVPLVISVSYGDDENSIEKDWADRLNSEFQMLALRGVSVLFASGDDGVGCQGNCRHSPNWPASSPFVTSVGGFVGTSTNTFIGDGISSGGFSDFYGMPSYQVNAVQNYLKTGPQLPPPSQYNASSRAMPDVSSFSENVMVIQGGAKFPVGGTSCASPVFAGVIALINDALLASGKKSLGFLNTALYRVQASVPDAFIDITLGANGAGCCKGFTATKGWDPITGLGAPNYPQLKAALMSLQK